MKREGQLSRKMEHVEIVFEAYAITEYSNICYEIYNKITNGLDYSEDREKYRKYVAEQTGLYIYYPTDWIVQSEEGIAHHRIDYDEFKAALYGVTILALNNNWLSEVSNVGNYKEPDNENYKKRTLAPLTRRDVKQTSTFEHIADAIYEECGNGINPYNGAGIILRDYIGEKFDVWTYYPSDWVYMCKKAIQEELIDIYDFRNALYGVTLLAVNNGWMSEVTDALIEEEA